MKVPPAVCEVDPAVCADDDEAALQSGLEQNPGDLDLCFRLVERLKARNEEPRAFEILAKGARECLEHGRFANAIRLLEKMLELRANHGQTHIAIGRTHLQLGHLDKALGSYARAFDAFLEGGKLPECETTLGLMARLDPDAIACKTRTAELMLRRGLTREAMALLCECARTLENEGQLQDYLDVGQRILEIDPNIDDIRLKVGEALIAEANVFVNYGLCDKAIEALQRAIALDPGQVEPRFALARILARTGRRAEARQRILEAVHEVAGPERKRELLLFARTLSDDPAHIARLAAELEIDLAPQISAVRWPALGEPSQNLADEATSPGYSLIDVSHEHSGERGPRLDAPSVVSNLTALLETVCAARAARKVHLQDAATHEPLAEIFVFQGRVLPGLRLEGRCFVDDELERQDPELADKLREFSDALSNAPADSDRLEGLRLTLTMKQKQLACALTARALATLAERAARTPLCSFLQPACRPAAPPPTCSPTSLLTEIAARHTAPPGDLAALVRSAHEFGDETWLMARAWDEEHAYLPLHYAGGQTERIDEMLAAIAVARTLSEHDAKMRRTRPGSATSGLGFIFPDGAWGALIEGNAMILARSAKTGIGRLLNRIHHLTREQAP